MVGRRTATNKAKGRDRPPLGGAPPINIQQRKPTDHPGEQYGPQAQHNQQQPDTRRSPDEVKADFDKYADALKQHKEDTESPDPPNTDDVDQEENDDGEDQSDQDRSYVYGDLDKGFSGDEEENEEEAERKRRQARIESKLETLNVEDIFTYGELRQRIVLENYTIEFRTTSGEEDLEIKNQLFSAEGTARYVIDKFALMNLCIGLRALNDQVWPSHLDKDDNFDLDLFNKKFKKLLKIPTILLEDMSLNYTWFNDRAKKIITADKLGNG